MAESNAPEHVIGVGKLQIQPDLSAVEAAFERMDKRLEEVREKASKIFDIADAIERLSSQIDALGERWRAAFTVPDIQLPAAPQSDSQPRDASLAEIPFDVQQVSREAADKQVLSDIAETTAQILELLQGNQATIE